RDRDRLAGALEGLDRAGHGRLQTGEGEGERRVLRPQHRAREGEGSGVAVDRRAGDRGPAGVAEPAQAGDLVEGLPGRVAEGSAEVLERVAHQIDDVEERGVAGGD